MAQNNTECTENRTGYQRSVSLRVEENTVKQWIRTDKISYLYYFDGAVDIGEGNIDDDDDDDDDDDLCSINNVVFVSLIVHRFKV